MKKIYSLSLFSSAFSSCLLLSPCAMALGEHNLDWAGRSRYAHVDAEPSGQAASVLLRATLDSRWNSLFTSELEVDHIATAFKDDHSDGVRLNDQPIIPDPPGTEINQAWLAVDMDEIFFKLGRQRINFDNQRFVGGNAFWQNEQTFDAALGTLKFFSNSQLTYTYIANANRIYGDDADKHNIGSEPVYGGPETRPAGLLGDHEHRSHLARFEWNEWDYTRVVAYGYRIDNRAMPAASNHTIGASYTLNYKQDAIKYRVQVEAARQNRVELDVDGLAYYVVDLGVGIGTYEFSSRYEILDAKDGAAFVTPLGSNHDFQGWADRIENTPVTGVRDFSLALLWRASPVRVETAYHFFSQAQGGDDIGQEWDLDFVYKPASKHAISLRFAHFEPDDDSHPVQKVFLDYSYNL